MAESRAQKFDPNNEVFQMRAQWKKQDVCRKQWHQRWDWLLDERKKALEEADKIREKYADALPKPKPQFVTTKSLKPVPQTTTGFIGWLSSKPECKLEIFTSWTNSPPIRLPDAWELPGYEPNKQKP